MKKQSVRNIMTWIVLIAVTTLASGLISKSTNKNEELTLSDFLNFVENGKVKLVEIKGLEATGRLQTGDRFHTRLTYYPDLIDELRNNGVSIKVLPQSSTVGLLISGLLNWLPMLVLLFVWIILMKGAKGGGVMSFAKSKAKLMTDIKGKVTFKDVAGIDEAMEELSEIVDFLKDTRKYSKIGAKIPKGCLLIGAPGTGKTLLAKAIAGEAHVPFFLISGSDFVEMFIGVGASRVRDMFEQAKKKSPCILFIDEIDAVGRHRGVGVGGGNDEREQTLNQLLVEMDGFEDNQGVIVVAATNRPDILDGALTRPGRFDRQITISAPDMRGRKAILDIHIKKVAAAPDIDTAKIAKLTPGFTGADLANIVNESALLTTRSNKKHVTMKEIEEAKDKVIMGMIRKNMIMSKDEKALTAYHEAGHAIVALNCPNTDPIHKATIVPRGKTLGLVMRLPEDDRFSVSYRKLIEDMAVAMGGRVAEIMIFGKDKVTTGASSDIKQATDIAFKMVTKWGLSDKVGAVYHKLESERVSSSDSAISSQWALELIDQEIQSLIKDAEDKAIEILKEKSQDLEKLAQALLKYELLTGEEIKDLLNGKEPDRESIIIDIDSNNLVPEFGGKKE